MRIPHHSQAPKTSWEAEHYHLKFNSLLHENKLDCMKHILFT